MDMHEYMQQQIEQAMSALNRWFCSQYYGHDIDDPEVLLRYYIQHGGAKDFSNQHRPKLQGA